VEERQIVLMSEYGVKMNYRCLQNRDWLPTDAVFSWKFCSCKGACPGFEVRDDRIIRFEASAV
jgi:hypothetical protein